MTTPADFIGSVGTPWPDPLKGPWTVTAHFALVNGRSECVGLDVRSFKMVQRVDDEGQSRAEYRVQPWAKPQPVTGAVLRSLPVAGIARVLRQDLADLAHWRAADQSLDKRTRGMLAKRAGELPETTYRVHSQEHYEQVAEVYAKAYRRGEYPTKAVAEELKATRSAAAKWVARARALGLLGETEKTKAGGVVAPRPAHKNRSK